MTFREFPISWANPAAIRRAWRADPRAAPRASSARDPLLELTDEPLVLRAPVVEPAGHVVERAHELGELALLRLLELDAALLDERLGRLELDEQAGDAAQEDRGEELADEDPERGDDARAHARSRAFPTTSSCVKSTRTAPTTAPPRRMGAEATMPSGRRRRPSDCSGDSVSWNSEGGTPSGRGSSVRLTQARTFPA